MSEGGSWSAALIGLGEQHADSASGEQNQKEGEKPSRNPQSSLGVGLQSCRASKIDHSAITEIIDVTVRGLRFLHLLATRDRGVAAHPSPVFDDRPRVKAGDTVLADARAVVSAAEQIALAPCADAELVAAIPVVVLRVSRRIERLGRPPTHEQQGATDQAQNRKSAKQPPHPPTLTPAPRLRNLPHSAPPPFFSGLHRDARAYVHVELLLQLAIHQAAVSLSTKEGTESRPPLALRVQLAPGPPISDLQPSLLEENERQ